MYLGRFRVGDSIPLSLRTVNASGTPTLPDTAPLAKIHNNAGVQVDSVSIPIKAKATETGYFETVFLLDGDYSNGFYTVYYNYLLSSVLFTREEPDTFEVMGTGDADGHIHSIESLDSPNGTDIIYTTQSQKLVKGRNAR